jgi:hypothetical protein
MSQITIQCRLVAKESTRQQKSKRVRGIEPLSLAWKAKVLPLNYTREQISNL